MSAIRFKTTPFMIGRTTVLLLPKDVSAKLPSRGMVLVRGTISGSAFLTPLEPDGRGSHWLKIDDELAGKTVEVAIEPSKDWPEPEVPADLQKALKADPEAQDIWEDITPMARWDWLRWIASTAKSETRAKHVTVALSKMKHGTRRPCCFNRSLCTVPEVSKGGALLEPNNSQ
jgi:hypothetical protein